MKDNIIIILSVVAAVAIASAIILPFVFGNVELNYEQQTPPMFNQVNYSTDDRTSHFIPTTDNNQNL
jgi:hypothetical protein